ncbi:MAG: hypothetical protein ACKO8G_00955, partial [Actinomycetota bacterium]
GGGYLVFGGVSGRHNLFPPPPPPPPLPQPPRVPAPLEVFLVVGGFLLIALSWLFCQVGDRRHELMVAGFATLVAFSVVLALVLAYPFAGDVRVEAEPFRLAVLSRFWP